MPDRTQSSDAIRRLISRPPKPCTIAPPAAGDPALSYTLTVTPGESRNGELEAVGAEMPGFDLSHPGPTVLLITHAGKWTRTHIEAAGMVGKNCTNVENPEGGITYSDHTDRLYFEADHEQAVPLAPQATIRSTWTTQPGERIEGRPTRVVTVEIAGPPPVRLRIWFLEDGELAGYARVVFTRLVGCPDHLGKAGFPSAELLALGLPVRVESYSFAFGNSQQPLVTSTVTQLKHIRAEPGDFAVPPGYDNLRDAQTLSARLGPDGFQSPQSRRRHLTISNHRDRQRRRHHNRNDLLNRRRPEHHHHQRPWSFSREGVRETLNHLERLTSYGVGWRSFTEQYLDSCGIFKDAVLAILAVIGKQEAVRLSERTRAGLDRAKRQGRTPGRPKRVFRRDDVVRLRDVERLSWRRIATALNIPVMTAVDAYRMIPNRTENVRTSGPVGDGNHETFTAPLDGYGIGR